MGVPTWRIALIRAKVVTSFVLKLMMTARSSQGLKAWMLERIKATSTSTIQNSGLPLLDVARAKYFSTDTAFGYAFLPNVFLNSMIRLRHELPIISQRLGSPVLERIRAITTS